MCRFKRTVVYIILGILVISALAFERGDSLIITSVIAGNKKFKTVSFDSKLLKPLTFEKDLPSTEFRRHRTFRPPKFDIDVNIPIKLPLEDEYPKEEHRKPVVSDFFFQTGDIKEQPTYGGQHPASQKPASSYAIADDQYAASSEDQASRATSSASTLVRDGLKGLLPTLAKSIKFSPKIEFGSAAQQSNARADTPVITQRLHQHPYQSQQAMIQPQQHNQQQQQPSAGSNDPMAQAASYSGPDYAPRQQYGQSNGYEQQDFVPGGFINLQLSGPAGGPKMTYEDYDKERWAQQLSQTEGAMPYPILNYHQLQNFYGGLGTFTNGLAEHRYVEHGLLDKFKSSLNHITSKLHLG